MALPDKKISKIKVDNSNTYDIVPSILQDGSTNNKLSIPTLTSDNDEVVTTKTSQTITGLKVFGQDSVRVLHDNDWPSNYLGIVSDQQGWVITLDGTTDLMAFDGQMGGISLNTIVLPNGSIDLGSQYAKWANAYISGNLSDGTNAITVADIVAKQDALPTTTTAGKVLKSTSTAGTVEWGDAPSSDTWRAVQVDGTQKLGTGTGTGALNFVSQNSSDGQVSFTYDGGIKAIAKLPTSLKNPNALRFFANTDTAKFVSYDGSSQVDLTFKPSSTAGAFEITDGTATKTIQLAGTFTDNNYYATSNFSSSNGTKIATGYSSGTTSTTYDLYAPNATASQAGLVTTGAQTFAGNKTFANPIYIQSSGQYPTNMGYLGGDSTNGLHLCASGPNLTLDTVGASIFIGTNTAGGQLKVSDASNVTTSGFTFTDKYKATSSSTVYTSTYTFPTKQADGSYTIATTDDFIDLSDRIQLDDAISANRPDTGSPTTPTTILTVAKFDAWYATGKTKIRMSGIGDFWADTCSYDTVTINGTTCNRIQTNMSGSSWNAYKYNNQVYAYGFNGGQDYIYFYGTDPAIYSIFSDTDYSKLAINAEVLSNVATISKFGNYASSGPISVFSAKTGGICPVDSLKASFTPTSTSLYLSSYTGEITLGNTDSITLSNTVGIAPGTSTNSHYFTHRLSSNTYNIYLPNKTGILATTDDLTDLVHKGTSSSSVDETVYGLKTFNAGIALNQNSAFNHNIYTNGGTGTTQGIMYNSYGGSTTSMSAINMGTVSAGTAGTAYQFSLGPNSQVQTTATVTMPHKTGTLAMAEETVAKSGDTMTGGLALNIGSGYSSSPNLTFVTSTGAGNLYKSDETLYFAHTGVHSYTLTFPMNSGTVALTSQIPSTSNFVTTDTSQQISGSKWFSNTNMPTGFTNPNAPLTTTEGLAINKNGIAISGKNNNTNTYLSYAFPAYSGTGTKAFTLAATDDLPQVIDLR